MLIQKNGGFYVEVFSRSSSVTGSCNRFKVHFPNGKTFQFLIDCGLFQGEADASSKNWIIPFDAEEIDAVFVTHNHVDHIGLLPLLVKQGYCNPIFASYGTYQLIDVALYDSCKIRDTTTGYRLYGTEDVDNTLKLMVGCCYKRVIKPHKNIRVVMYPNGHLIGASIILVQISYAEESINLLFTGDYNNKNMFFHVESLPETVRNMHISALFTESTYGDIDSNNPKFAPCIIKNTKKAILDGKTVIFPAFSQGRFQEMLLYLKNMQEKNLLPLDIPIWGDGYSSLEYTKRYRACDLGVKKLRTDFIPQNFHTVERKEKREIRRAIIADKSPKIILAPGGMGSYGPIQSYICKYIERDDALIHYLGYCSPESKASVLMEADYGSEVTYAGIPLTKRCEFKRSGERSAHAKRNELRAFAQSLNDLSSVFITHGEPETRSNYGQYLKDYLDESVQISNLDPVNVYRINANGIADVYSAYFHT